MSWSHRCRASARCASPSNRNAPAETARGAVKAPSPGNYLLSDLVSDFGCSALELELEELGLDALGLDGLGLALEPEAALPDVLPELAPPLA